MLVLDENIDRIQREQLSQWRFRFRHIGNDVASKGIKDDRIQTVLHQLKQPTFFSWDRDFYKRELLHRHHCIVYLDVKQFEIAEYIRKTLKHEAFSTKTSRMGKVIRVSPTLVQYWELNANEEKHFFW